jgi:hypothetical protein
MAGTDDDDRLEAIGGDVFGGVKAHGLSRQAQMDF